MRRGDVVIAVAPGDFGKPRPAVVIQARIMAEAQPSVILCLISSELVESPLFRITVEPTEENGLKQTSQIMVDKIMTVRRHRIGGVAGRLDREIMRQVDRALLLVLGLAE